jgi:hypothetical protein
MIGYWLVQALQGAAAGKPAACLICRTVVHPRDPAFGQPSKFVGPVYDEATALRLAADQGWDVRQDGKAWRRVVPSPEPIGLLELDMIRVLVSRGVMVVCAGGGGVPVVADGPRRFRGVDLAGQHGQGQECSGRHRGPLRSLHRFVEATGAAAVGRPSGRAGAQGHEQSHRKATAAAAETAATVLLAG